MFPVTDPILIFTILALAILAAPLFSDRFRVPDLVLLLGFGALLGPNGLHVLERNEGVTLLGSVGLLYIMFLAGIEIDLYRFRRSYRRSVLFGLLTFLIPQSLGTLAGRYVLGLDWPAAVLLASMFASHTLLAYPLASRLGISRSEPVAVSVGATIITDTLALLVLAVIADSAKGIALGPGLWITLFAGMFALTLMIWKGIPFVARWFFRSVTEKNNAQFLFVIVTVCGFAYLSHFARMEPIIGAFLAGAAFNRLIPENSALMNRINFAGHTLFIPFFLISVGMLVDLRSLAAGGYGWLVGVTMIGTVVLTKFLAAQLTRRLLGYSRASGGVMFGLTVVQAAATLAAVVVGYNLGIIGEPVLNGAILMILVTCPLGSWMVDRYGRRMAAEAPVQATPSGGEQRLMVPVSNPEYAIRLLDLAFLMRDTARPGGIYPVTVVTDQDDIDEAVAGGEKLLANCLAHAVSAEMTVNPGLRVAVNVSDGITHAARELRAGRVIIGWTGGQSVSVRFFGTLMNRLVEDCGPGLLFCRLVSPLNTTRRMLVPFPPMASRRREADSLIREIKRLAHGIGAGLRVYTVADEAEILRSMMESAKPACRLSFVQSRNWKELQKTLFSDIDADDLMLLPVDRREGVLWTPALDHLPEIVAARFPKMNLLVDYPSLPDFYQESFEYAGEEEPHIPLLLPVDLTLDNTLEKAVRMLAAAAFPSSRDKARAAIRHLLDSMRSYPIELAPGTVLIHSKFGNMEKPLLMVGHAPDGWPLPGIPRPPRIILLLLGPQSRPPDWHLKTLSVVARRIHQIGLDHDPPSAADAEAIAELFGWKIFRCGNGPRFSE